MAVPDVTRRPKLESFFKKNMLLCLCFLAYLTKSLEKTAPKFDKKGSLERSLKVMDLLSARVEREMQIPIPATAGLIFKSLPRYQLPPSSA